MTVHPSTDLNYANVVRFGPFTFDLRTGEIYDSGVRCRLQPQPARILAMLVRRAGEMVTREEIGQVLWNSSTYVDFDNGINFCLRHIRAVLRDDARHPQYVETLLRRGYRFVASVISVDSNRRILAEPIAENRVLYDSQELKQTVQDRRVSNTEMVISGVKFSDGQQLRITAELIDSSASKTLWKNTCHGSLHGGPLSKRSAASFNLTGIELAPMDSHSPVSKLYIHYVKGLHHFEKRTEAGIKNAIEHLKHVIRHDRRCALAYTGLANCYFVLCLYGFMPAEIAYPRAMASVRRALELDGGLAEAHTTLACSKMLSEWEWEEAEKEFQQAIALDPNCATAHQWYADYLTATGRHVEALAEMSRAWVLSPLSINIGADLGWTLCHARRYDEAIDQYRNILEMEPTFFPAHWGLGLSYLEKSMFEEAISELRVAVSLSGESLMMLAALGYAYAVAGKKSHAKSVLAQLKKSARRRYVPPFEMAALCAALGEMDEAFTWFQNAFDKHTAYLIYIKVDPRLLGRNLDPRLRGLAKRVGLDS